MTGNEFRFVHCLSLVFRQRLTRYIPARYTVMVVFMGNFPKTAVEKELCQIARLNTCSGLRITRKKARSGEMLRYALVPVSDERHAQRLIRRMRQTLSAHSCASRVAGNEQRRLDWRTRQWVAQERRLSERRGQSVAAGLRVA